MITYEKILDTVRTIVNNDLIYRQGLMLVYSLDENTHKKLEETIFMKSGGVDWDEFEYQEEFEIEIGGVLIKFIIDDED